MKLHEIDLPIGKTLALKMVGLDYKSYQIDVEFIGYAKGKSLMVSVANKPGQVLFQAGATAQLAAQLPEGTVWFEADIEYIHESPFLYLVLEYPVGVEFERRRQHSRFKVDTAVEVMGYAGLGMKTSSLAGYMLDVSVGGGRITLEKELTAMVTKIDVGVKLVHADFERDMTLAAKVKNNAALSDSYPECGFSYGIEFIDIESVDALFLQAYCLRAALDNKALLC
jgi:hypothetical protein